ncbi:shikimate O-hydroxycinnamoyltransferase [Selaginella moellendorffii]|uniref:shikimate O-hydroxycinnamoyltransferase n=1 Tax=Selaginella moellendorffii TaxID=88036 RepID=UPI000D1CBEF5|nr:shikimate O-hydroxycinnamoyltransferase [Selaginella moellendorffii]|eukprot:XP_024530298.1 shikimate O-hydroxycinnamoyltransferase [Selaginella moellendorffii]
MEEVRIVSVQMVAPAEPPNPSSFRESIKLTLYDRAMRFALYQKRILFYNPVEPSSIDCHIQSLKGSLAQALVSFYPLAGRLSSSSLEIDCSTLSVQFTEAVTDATLGDLAIRPSSFCDKLCDMGSSPTWPWSPDLPLLFAQVTRFVDGGISVAIAFSHQVCDGVSGWHFFNSWAQIARDGVLRNPPVVSYEVEEQDMELEEAFEVAASIGYKVKKSASSPRDLSKPRESISSSSMPQLDVRLFRLDQSHISELKSRCLEETRASFSSYEVVCAYFWTLTARHRGLRPDQEAAIAILFDSRGRFAKVPEFYLGNAIATAIVSARVEDLTSKGIGYAAGLLHDAIVSMDEKKNQAQLKFMYHVMETGFITEMEIDPASFSLVVSSPRHPVYETDFGFGRPAGVTFGTNDLSDGKIYLFPSPAGNRGVEVSVVLHPERFTLELVLDLESIGLPQDILANSLKLIK